MLVQIDQGLSLPALPSRLSPLYRTLCSPSSLISPLLSHLLLPAQKTHALCLQRSKEVKGKLSSPKVSSASIHQENVQAEPCYWLPVPHVPFPNLQTTVRADKILLYPGSLLQPQEGWLERDLQTLHPGEPTSTCVRVLEIRSPFLSSSRQRRQEKDETGFWGEPPGRQSTGLAGGSQHVANTKPPKHMSLFSLKLTAFLHFLTEPK